MPTRRRRSVTSHAKNVLVIQQNLPFHAAGVDGFVDPVQCAKERRLAAARGTDQGGDPLFLNLEIDAMQSLEGAIEEVEIDRLHLGPGSRRGFNSIGSGGVPWLIGRIVIPDSGIVLIVLDYPLWVAAPRDKTRRAAMFAISTMPSKTRPAAHAWRCQSSYGEMA